MHVSNLRPLPVVATTPVQSRAEHKGAVDDPDKVPPVKRRFEDDERQAQQRRRPRWLDDPAAGAEGDDEEAAATEEPAHAAPTVIATPALQSAQPIADLLAGVTSEAAPAQEAPAAPASDGKPSLDDLLTLMRTGPK